jgi:uncharacterized protein (DUF305 family)
MVYRNPRAAALCLAAILSLTATAALAHDPAGHDHHQATSGSDEIERAYLAETDAAMTKMMADMEAEPAGDVDRDFVTMMIPHHQGAIDMAIAVLKYGKNPQLKRIAQEIIVEQQQEINAMKLAVGDPLPPSAAAPTQTVDDLHKPALSSDAMKMQ